MGSLAWDLWLGSFGLWIFGFEILAWDLGLRHGSLAWDLWVEIMGLGRWDPETGGAVWRDPGGILCPKDVCPAFENVRNLQIDLVRENGKSHKLGMYI